MNSLFSFFLQVLSHFYLHCFIPVLVTRLCQSFNLFIYFPFQFSFTLSSLYLFINSFSLLCNICFPAFPCKHLSLLECHIPPAFLYHYQHSVTLFFHLFLSFFLHCSLFFQHIQDVIFFSFSFICITSKIVKFRISRKYNLMEKL